MVHGLGSGDWGLGFSSLQTFLQGTTLPHLPLLLSTADPLVWCLMRGYLPTSPPRWLLLTSVIAPIHGGVVGREDPQLSPQSQNPGCSTRVALAGDSREWGKEGFMLRFYTI